MRRILAFLIGALLSAGLLYFLRRVLSSPDAAAVTPDSTPPATPVPQPTSPLVGEATSQGTKFTVRRTGPRPQPIITSSGDGSATPETVETTLAGESEGRHTEPVAATETDKAATSPRSETAEPAVPEDILMMASVDANSVKGATETSDDFTVIEDIGPVFNDKLRSVGITTFAELAALSPEDIEAKTTISASRIERNKWIEQAAQLAKGSKPSES